MQYDNTAISGKREAMSNQTISVKRIKQQRKREKIKAPQNQCGSLPFET
jgi:hypothetical protein